MASLRLMAEDLDGSGRPEWLRVIHEVNRLHDADGGEKGDRPFSAPEHLGPWWAGGSVEEYPDARVLHRGDGTVSIVSKTERGDELLRRAAASLKIHHN